MKILVLGDLHYRKDWYAWVLKQIPNFDLVALPGDLLDCFGENLNLQKAFVTDWVTEAASHGVPLAWCSGNHDITRWSFIHPDLRSGACWTDQLRGPFVVGDFESMVFSGDGKSSFLVTCLPYIAFRNESVENRIESLLDDASQQRKTLRCPWILLNHIPPSRLPLARGEGGKDLGDELLRSRVKRYSPNLVLSGHVHQGPFSGRFWDIIDQSVCFNAGYVVRASVPCHIVSDNERGIAAFHYELDGHSQTLNALYRPA